MKAIDYTNLNQKIEKKQIHKIFVRKGNTDARIT